MFLNISFCIISKTFNFKLGNLDIAPTYWQAIAIVFLLFLLVFTLARVRYLYIHWSLGKNSIAFLFWGFILALILEGFLIIGGKTVLTEVLGWQDVPKPINTALDLGRKKLINVLGVKEEIPKNDKTPTYKSVVGDYLELRKEDREIVYKFVCQP